MKKLLVLTALLCTNTFAGHAITTYCKNDSGSITYTKNKSAESLEINGQVVAEGFDNEVMIQVEGLNVKSHDENYSCEQTGESSGRYISSSETIFSGTFTLKNGQSTIIVDMDCQKFTQSTSHGSETLCNNDLEL